MRLLLLSVITVFVACSANESNKDVPAQPEVFPEATETQTQTTTETQTSEEETALPEVDVESAGSADLYPPLRRDRHRVDIDQLDTLITQATGVRWVDSFGGSNFDKYEASLGRPEYLERINEDLTPNLMFMKFLSDAAKATCTQLMLNELSAEPEGRRFLVEIDEGETDAAKVSANMRYVLLHFHGYRYPEGDERLQPWIDLFNEGVQLSNGDSNLAWEGICNALIRHPDFYSI